MICPAQDIDKAGKYIKVCIRLINISFDNSSSSIF